jgi:hypothetical protein
MLAVRRTVTALILAMTAAGSGAADSRTVDAGSLPYCAGLRGIVAAAGGWPPFQPVSAWERVVVPGFEQPCGLRSHGIGWRFVCSRPDSDGPDDMARLVAQTAACLDEAVRLPDEAEGRRARFRTATAALQIERPEAAGSTGPTLTLTVYPIPIW